MPTSRTDLLVVTRTLLRWAFYIDIGLMLLLAVVLTGVLLGDATSIRIAGTGSLPPEQRLFAARVGVAGALIGCALALPVLRQALAVVDSARDGDPFVPQNGARLRRIGWLMLTINFVMTTTITIALKHAIAFPPVSLTAVLTVLMIFVIARIFETGSRMRTELQETI